MSIIGDCFSYTLRGEPMRDFDQDVSADYAQRYSADWPNEIVEFVPKDGTPSRYFRGGLRAAASELHEARVAATRNDAGSDRARTRHGMDGAPTRRK